VNHLSIVKSRGIFERPGTLPPHICATLIAFAQRSAPFPAADEAVLTTERGYPMTPASRWCSVQAVDASVERRRLLIVEGRPQVAPTPGS